MIRCSVRGFLAGIGILAFLATPQADATPVGEIHRVTSVPTAGLRDAESRTELRVTIWYPAAADSSERDVAIGPPDKPLFDVGRAAPDAALAPDGGRRPVILLSHGYGGSARMMGWFGIEMARDGYIVVAVDHPGNNGADTMTVAGAILWWDRAEDLRAALKAAEQDQSIGPRMDLSNVGVAGFSAGGPPPLWPRAPGSIPPTLTRSVLPIPAMACAGRNWNSASRQRTERTYSSVPKCWLRPTMRAPTTLFPRSALPLRLPQPWYKPWSRPAWRACAHRLRSCLVMPIRWRRPPQMAR